jgi:hypothetical protein
MKLYFCLAAVIIASFFSSCAVSSKKENVEEEVVFDDGYRKTTAGEMGFADNLNPTEQSTKTQKNSTDFSTEAPDDSQIAVMTDSAGNRTETRCFENHLRIGCVALNTSARGVKEALIYTRNGEVKRMQSEELFGKILTASADDLAQEAGIFEIKRETSLPTVTYGKSNGQPLQPMPSYKFNVRQPVPVESAVAEPATEETSAPAAEQNGNQPEEKRPAVSENRPPDGEKDN